MLFREVFRLTGFYLMGLALILLVPLSVAGYYEFIDLKAHHPQPHTTLYFFYTVLITGGLGFLGYWYGKETKRHLYRREGIAAVVLIWFLTPAIAALPFVLSGTLTNPMQAYFEMVSGFTTTGASILEAKNYDSETGKEIPVKFTIPGVYNVTYSYYGTVDPVIDPVTGESIKTGIEAVSKALLFWRSFSQWLGGVGVVVLFVAILPVLGVGGKMLYQAEVPGPIKEGITPRIKETAVLLWKVYLGLTLLQILLLIWVDSKMEWFDAITLTFSTISTGGFTVTNTSVAAYKNLGVEWIVIVFMMLGGINFSLYFFALKGKVFRLKDPELLLYLFVVLLCGSWISYSIIGADKMDLNGNIVGVYTIPEAIKNGFFQLISAQTSTGFVFTNFDIWPYLPQLILFISMYVGAMSGSTSGGVKVIRYYMLFRVAFYRIESIFRSESIRKIRIGGKEIGSEAATMVLVYFLAVVFISVFANVFFVADGYDPETSLGMVGSLMNNIGIGFRAASPLHSFAFLSDKSLLLSSILMILGRLEFFAFLALLVPAFWSQDS